MDISLIATLVKRLVAACFALVVVWHVAQHARHQSGRAIVHVTQPDVMVEVDDRPFYVGSLRQSPLVCELEPGPHRAEVWRNGKVVGEGRFIVQAGEDVIVRPSDIDAAGRRSDRDAKPIDADLAVRTRRPDDGPTRN